MSDNVAAHEWDIFMLLKIESGQDCNGFVFVALWPGIALEEVPLFYAANCNAESALQIPNGDRFSNIDCSILALISSTVHPR
uniref:Uncharacterized protein n=1 Tax=Echinococcus canadensis TaxID=519352 RepID=A0A915EVR6_9CEST